MRTLTIIFLVVCASATGAFAQHEYAIDAIQGTGDTSPHAGESVRTTGVVTAITSRGFYMQTPDDKADSDPKTSEGIYVFGEQSVAAVSLGALVQVDGTVSEFRPRGDFYTTTELTRPSVQVISKGNPLPAPIMLTPSDLDPKGKLDQMERFEGMRVRADVVVVGPTGGFTNEKTGVTTSNGVFFTTLDGVPRPFREPGLDVTIYIAQKLPEKTPWFDMNPEILRVDTAAQTGSKPLDLPAGATIKQLTGVIDYAHKFYTLVADGSPAPVAENIKGFVPLSPAGDREVTVGSFNIENFFDDEVNSPDVQKEEVLPKDVFRARLNKASLAIRTVLSMPDVLGICEVENLKVLQKVADKINADVVASGRPDPKYVPYLEEGNDVRGIDVGFLVKSTKIKVVEVKQLAKKETFRYAGVDNDLFDRPPLMLRADAIDAATTKPLAFTVIVNHIKSYRGIDDEKEGDRVRTKRRLEAEWLGKFVEDREKADPGEKLILCGDYNSFQFNDGYNDLIGIITGRSDANVLSPSDKTFATGLVDLVNFVDPKMRYSYSYDGSAQVLDHVLVNRPLRSRVLKFGYARVDADFPVAWSNDGSRPERLSDHDAPVVFLNMDEPAAKPASK